jgi:hypothetical protein
MGYIFETEIEQIKNVVHARTIGEAESITLEDILESKVHSAIKAYFRAEVERNLQQERQLEIRSKKFPYSISEIVSLQHQEDLLLMLHYQFNQHEFNDLLDQAVHFTFNFLCRPQFTLVEFLFENQRKMSTSVIEQKLNYCTEYEYYALLLRRYFVDKGLAEVTYEEFKTLLKKIDAEVVALHSDVELAGMTKAIMGFVEAVQDGSPALGKPKSLPINAAIVFFEDKGLQDIKLRLEYERDHNKLDNIGLQQLAGIIKEVRAIATGTALAVSGSDSEATVPAPVIEQPIPVTIQHAATQPADNEVTEDVGQTAREQETGDSLSPLEDNQSTPAPPTQVLSENMPDLNLLFSGGEEKKILK